MLSPKMVPLATVFSTSGPTQVVLKRWSVCRETLTWFQQLVSVVLPDAFATLGNHRNHQRLPNHKEPAYNQGSARQCFACRGTDLMKKIFLRWFGSTKTVVGRQFLCFESWTEHFSNFRLQLHLGKQEGHLDDGIRDERRTAIHGSSWFEKESRLDAIR